MLLSNPFRPDPRVLKEGRSLVRAGYQVHLVCWDREKDFARREQLDGLNIHRIAVESSYSAGSRQVFYLPRFWMKALKQLCALEPDIVHCHDLDTAPVGFWYGFHRSVPWIFDAHECYPEQMSPQVNRMIYYILLFIERQMARRATHVITVGELLAERFRSFGATVTVVGNYQSLEAVATERKVSRQDLGLDSNRFLITYIGGFTLARAILPLIRAAELVQDAVVLLGGDGPQRQEIEAAASNHPQVHYIGWVPAERVLDHMALSDVIYYGLNTHGGNSQYSTPNTLFNALAVGRPILTTDVGEIAQIVRAEHCGIIVDEPTPSAIAQGMMKLRDLSLSEQLRANASRLAQTRYNWTIAERNLLNVYKKALGDEQ